MKLDLLSPGIEVGLVTTNLEAMVAFCRRGPDTARVQSVDVSDVEADGSREFTVR